MKASEDVISLCHILKIELSRLIVIISLIPFLGQLVAIPGGDMCHFFESGVVSGATAQLHVTPKWTP